MSTPYRNGNHNARNIYKHSFAADREAHIGVMFTPEDGRLAVDALNLAHNTRIKAAITPTPVHQYLVRAFMPDQIGKVATDNAQPYRSFYAFASDEVEAARVFHARNPRAVIRDLWQLMPPGYLGANVFTPDHDSHNLCAAPVKANACKVDERAGW